MAEPKELKAGQTYWFLSVKQDKLIELTFMNKVSNRKAYRFAEKGKKQLFIVHSSRIGYVYAVKWEAKTAFSLHMGRRKIQEAEKKARLTAGYIREQLFLDPPDIYTRAVARGFPRRVRFGRW